MSLVLDADVKGSLGTLKFGGKEYPMEYPTFKQIKEFQKESEESDSSDAYINLLCKIGIPKEVCENMPFNLMSKITNKIKEEVEGKK